MNFYKHHLGDYDGATVHLSWDEDMAYTRLMRVYYHREQPIPDSEKYRLVRASSKPHRTAVDAVLSEFFELRDGCWHQKRCDEEIDAYREEGVETAAKRENERERQRRHRERRKELFAALREHRIVPKWDTSIEDLEALLSQQLKRASNGTGHAPETVTMPELSRTCHADNDGPATAIQTPEPEPVRKRVPRRSRETPLPDDFGISERVVKWAAEKKIHNIERHFEVFVSKCKAKGYTYIDWDEAFMNAVRDDWARIGYSETKAPQERFPI